MIDFIYWATQIENNILQISKLVITAIIFLTITLYLIFKNNRQYIINNWVEYRCNPFIMPFAGFFGKPVSDNFMNCLWVLVKKYAGFLLMPIKYITQLIHNVLKDFGNSINSIRKMTLQIRTFFLSIIGNVMSRLWGVIGDMQYFVVKLRYTMKSAYGLMVGVIYTGYTAIETMQSTWNGPIGEFARFFCFHPNTKILLVNNLEISINKLKINDEIYGGGKVLGVLEFDYPSDEPLYLYNNIYVSKYHIVYSNKYSKWIRIKDLDDNEYQIIKHNLPNKLYSIITEKHILVSNNTIFTDYIENDNPLLQLHIKSIIINHLNHSNNHKINELTINNYIVGFNENTSIQMSNNSYKYINQIKIGDKTKHNGKIIGIIKQITNSNLYIYQDMKCSGDLIIQYNEKWIYMKNHPLSINYINKQPIILYHIITEMGVINIMDDIFRDYLELSNKKINNYIDNLIIQDMNHNFNDSKSFI